MTSTTVCLCSSLTRFSSKKFVSCRTFSTTRPVLENRQRPPANRLLVRWGQDFLAYQPMPDNVGIYEHNQMLFDRTRTKLLFHGDDGSPLSLRLALNYTIDGSPLVSSRHNRLQWIPKEAEDRRNWQMCITIRHTLSPLNSSPNDTKPTLLLLPIGQAAALQQRLQLLDVKGGGSDSHRLAGPLFGTKKCAFYLSVCRPPTTTSRFRRPLVFLSAHFLLPNEFHAWYAVVHSIPLPVDHLFALSKCLRYFLAHPEAVAMMAKSATAPLTSNNNSQSRLSVGQIFFS
ncbi:hypothetical protein GPALN_010943 [Globodera pallida]|nr:hypothetical protein GPALN_010943 [Globodera pallida]